MAEYWPSFGMDVFAFWGHEWSRHGTCAAPILPSQHKYFKTILKLHKKYPLQNAFEEADILPDDNEAYSVKSMAAAIKDAFSAYPLIHCDEQKEVSEIWMCIDEDLKAFDCPSPQNYPACSVAKLPRFSKRQ